MRKVIRQHRAHTASLIKLDKAFTDLPDCKVEIVGDEFMLTITYYKEENTIPEKLNEVISILDQAFKVVNYQDIRPMLLEAMIKIHETMDTIKEST